MATAKTEIIRCERCGEILKPTQVQWLELSETDGNYYSPKKFPADHTSQGGFAFGKICAAKEIYATEEKAAYTEIETEILEKLKGVKETTAWGYVIVDIMKAPTPAKIRPLIRQLSSQADDNPEGMKRILGFDILAYS